MQPITLQSKSPQTTAHIGQRLGRAIQPGQVIALIGDLGAGKTTFTQGIAQGLEISGPVSSPTFTFVNEYSASKPVSPARTGSRGHAALRLIHIDLYRLPETIAQAVAEAATFGLDEILDEAQAEESDTVVIIEWAERAAPLLPSDHLQVELMHSGHAPEDNTVAHTGSHKHTEMRVLVFTAHGPQSKALLTTLQS